MKIPLAHIGEVRRWRVVHLFTLTALLGLCGCAVHPARMPWQFYNDTALTRKVNQAIKDSHVNAANMHVSTFDYTVRLAGSVNTPADKEQAVTAARRVSGVREVLDYIQVAAQPPPAQAMPGNSQ